MAAVIPADLDLAQMDCPNCVGTRLRVEQRIATYDEGG